MAQIYPFKKYNYIMMIEKEEAAGFSEVSAPDVSVAPIEYREGNYKAGKQPGLIKYGNITLKWGMSASMVLLNWIKDAEQGKINRKTVTIILRSDQQEELAKWTIVSAWPTKYTAPDFNSSGKETAIESLELAHEGLTRDK